MILLILCLAAVSFAISWLITLLMRSLAVRIGFVDKPGGRKIHANPKPLGGGVGIFWGMALPILVGLAFVNFLSPPEFLRTAPWMGSGGEAGGLLVGGAAADAVGAGNAAGGSGDAHPGVVG